MEILLVVVCGLRELSNHSDWACKLGPLESPSFAVYPLASLPPLVSHSPDQNPTEAQQLTLHLITTLPDGMLYLVALNYPVEKLDLIYLWTHYKKSSQHENSSWRPLHRNCTKSLQNAFFFYQINDLLLNVASWCSFRSSVETLT